MATTEHATLPVPRPGIHGLWDRLAGPGATRAENAVILVWAAVCAVAVVVHPIASGLGWSPAQLAVGCILALDLGGGVPANATRSARRWYHRPGQGFGQHFGFLLVHLHPFVLPLLFAGFSWAAAALVYGYLLLAGAAILTIPAYLRRPMAAVLAGAAILGGLYLLDIPKGLEWFIPLYFLKLLWAHLVPPDAQVK